VKKQKKEKVAISENCCLGETRSARKIEKRGLMKETIVGKSLRKLRGK